MADDRFYSTCRHCASRIWRWANSRRWHGPVQSDGTEITCTAGFHQWNGVYT